MNELPGMGGVNNNENFILNCDGWNKYSFVLKDTSLPLSTPIIALAPMTGAIENAGWKDEKSFYKDIFLTALKNNARLCIGDGTPDEKLLYGIKAVKELSESEKNLKAGVFIKPYENRKIFERAEWAISSGIAESFGIDIDAYNIVTMRNKANLEKKDSKLLLELKNFFNKKGFPFIIKGIFSKEDIELVNLVKPDVAYISNHGGRVVTEKGSTADFLFNNAEVLKQGSKEIWVDGGIRTQEHINIAAALKADRVLMGRPFITKTIKEKLQKLHSGFQSENLANLM